MSAILKDDTSTFFRRSTRTVYVGKVPVGSGFPVRIQSMTNTLTGDTDATTAQCIRIIDAGADFVRITVPSPADADSLGTIRQKLHAKGYTAPLIADVHFNAGIALQTATLVEKVRINPGNFGIGGRYRKSGYTQEEYTAEWERQRKVFKDFLELCRRHHTAIRIGVNHGSLSDRIMHRYGDTPEGMAESALEFLRVCRDESFHDVIVSLKSSNTLVMVYATRLLVHRMEGEGMQYPLHLGVTEAGEGEDGRIKSAVGIGTLLADGIGDTIRVSLTEEPEAEIPVAKKLVAVCAAADNDGVCRTFSSPPAYLRRKSHAVAGIGGTQVPLVLASTHRLRPDGAAETAAGAGGMQTATGLMPDYLVIATADTELQAGTPCIVPLDSWLAMTDREHRYPLIEVNDTANPALHDAKICFLRLAVPDIPGEVLSYLKGSRHTVIIADTGDHPVFSACRNFFSRLADEAITAPVIVKGVFDDADAEGFQLAASVHVGSLLVDGLGDGIWLEGRGHRPPSFGVSTAFGILQATRTRVSRTEYIACPSCGRTHFSLMETLAAIKARTAHLKGLKIGVMGCIVNGPGEMADADYGYVGSGKGTVTLYKGREVIRRGIPEARALDELIRVIRENGDWRE